MKGEKFLKIPGIAMIVFGGLAALYVIVLIINGGVIIDPYWDWTMDYSGISAFYEGPGVIWNLLMLVCYVLMILTGVKCMRFCDKVSKADECLKWSIITASAFFVSISTITAMGQGFKWLPLHYMVILCTLTIIGACLNKKETAK